MGFTRQTFDTRQYMRSDGDFEFFHYRDEPTLEIGFHNHDFYEIYFFISGKVTYIVEGKSYRLRQGDIFLINNREVHKPVLESGCIYERVVIWVKPEFMRKYSTDSANLSACFDSTLKNKHNLLRPGANMQGVIRNALARLEQACSSMYESSFGKDVLGSLYLAELLVYLNMACLDSYRENIQEDIVVNGRVSDIIRRINDNLGENLSLDRLSKEFYISKYHLLREFKKYTGYSPHEYALHKRLIHSRELLKEGGRISDICQSCGFGDYSNFYRSFKKAYGISPKEFRQGFRR